MKWKGNPGDQECCRYDYRWIKDKEERNNWIKKHYDLTKKELELL